MLIQGCNCLNILIHVDRVISTDHTSGYLDVELTFDGITVQRHFLTSAHEQEDGVQSTACKVCNVVTHKKDKQQIQIAANLVDYTDIVLDVQNKDSFSKSYNLILPLTAPSCPQVPDAASDIEQLHVETEHIKNEMKSASEDRIAQFLREERRSLQISLKKTERDMQILRGLIHNYHHTHRPASAPSPQHPDLPDPAPISRSFSEKKVKFSTNVASSPPTSPTLVTIEERPQLPPTKDATQLPPAKDDIMPFDMDEAFGDLEEEVGEVGLLGDQSESPQSESDFERELSSSSGCEADIDRFGGQSVPINVPMNYERPQRRRQLSSSNKDEDIAHSMREAMAEFHDREHDVPRPRLSKSFNPNRFILP